MGTDRHTTPGRGPRHGHRSRRGKGNPHNGRPGLLWTYNGTVIIHHNSRKRDRTNDDGSFVQHLLTKERYQRPSRVTGTLEKGESRDKLGEWLKKTTVRSMDQRRMLQAITHSDPSNSWRYKITNEQESKKCDLCKALWTEENRFTTEGALPDQDLVHIQHTCEALSEIHTMTLYRCWLLIHGELL